MTTASFRNEYELQSLIAAAPSIIPANACRSNEPRRWLLLQKEASIINPARPEAPWAVDVLLIDQDAIPTLVEIKHNPTGPSARRKSVGQLIDYLVGARATWSARTFAAAYATASRDESDSLRRHTTLAAEEFWRRAEHNLRASRIRVIYVANETPMETIAAIELLNSQLRTIEAYAVQVTRTESGHVLGVITQAPPARPEAPAPPKPKAKRDRFQLLEPAEVEEHLREFWRDADPRSVSLVRLAQGLGFTLKRETKRGKPHSCIRLYPHPAARSLFTLAPIGSWSYMFGRSDLQDAGLSHPHVNAQLRAHAATVLGGEPGACGGMRLEVDREYQAFADMITWVANALEFQTN